MTDELVLVDADSVVSYFEEQFSAACEQAQVQACPWRPGAEVEGQPALFVAALQAGEREIPQRVTDLLTHEYPELPALFLCDEPLVRPRVSLCEGRITLLGVPLTSAAISSRVRFALAPTSAAKASEASVASAAPADAPEGGLQAREFRGPAWWAACLSRGLPAETSADTTSALPRITNSASRGLAACLQFGAQLPAEEHERAQEHACSGELARLEQLLGERAAGLWICPARGLLTVYCPRESARFWLLSPTRVPNHWDLAAGKTVRQMKVGSGDVLVLATGLDPHLEAGAETLSALQSELEQGGPGSFSRLEELAAASEDPLALIVVEAR